MATEVNLPEEIIIEILSRLPVKSLIRFRSVSKSWHTIITDPSFIKKHLSQSTRYNHLSLKRALLCTSSSSELVSCHVSCLSNNSIKEAEKLYPLERKIGRVFILGACNGLFWIWVHKEMFLWNPSTRRTKKLPHSPFHMSIHIHRCNFFPGFNISALGYDSCHDDYKVLNIVKFPLERAETMLYSLKSDSWTIIQDYSPYRFDLKTTGKFVSGAFHWLICHGQDSSASYAIVSFDLSEEKYGKVPLPDDLVMPKSRDQRFDLGVLRGMLCLHCNYFDHCFILWTMKEYGVEKSWTQILKFQYYNEPMPFFPSKSFVCLIPKLLFENGELLLEARNIHDGVAVLKYKEQRLVVVICGGLTELGETHIYPESLVSPL